MNQIKLPKKVKVSGFNYHVIFPYSFDDKMMGFDPLGFYEPATLKIKIAGYTQGNAPIPPSGVVCCFLHEVFHAIDRSYCNDEIQGLDNTIENNSENSEIAIPSLTYGWYQVLKDNRIFTVENIPKKIKIAGFDYVVKYPYDIEGEDSVHAYGVEHYKQVINIKNIHLKDSTKYDFQNIRFMLLQCITNAVIFYYIHCFSFSPELVHSFSNGLYQVLVDNKIEELIHKYK